ncbi:MULTISPECIES: hypothetical protein [unclassified Streptomyces]|uniref:hypothetical protein n=1 Tax=unclassified Streptomyces TaxID=2593676 RepID=UPI0038056790
MQSAGFRDRQLGLFTQTPEFRSQASLPDGGRELSPQDPAQESFDYEQELHDLVHDIAPRFFAVVVEYRDGEGDIGRDAAVVAWGMAQENGVAEVTRMDGGGQLRLAAPENVKRYFGRADGCSPRIVWLAPVGVAQNKNARAA